MFQDKSVFTFFKLLLTLWRKNSLPSKVGDELRPILLLDKLGISIRK